MTKRSSTAVIVTTTTLNHEGVEQKMYYGPFLPHGGSSTTSFVHQLESELEASGRYTAWHTSIETLFLAEGESDCEVRPVR